MIALWGKVISRLPWMIHSMDASHFRDQAARCQRWAAQLRPGDPAREALIKLAEEYESKARRLRERSSRDPSERFC